MLTLRAITVISLLLPHAIGAIGQSKHSDESNIESIVLTLELSQGRSSETASQIDGWVTVKNDGNRELNIQSLSNRLAVAFVVFDSAGNFVPPKGLAKVDPRTRQVALKPGMKLKERFDGLKFITGTAQFGYDLIKGRRYTVVAIYRPTGSKNAGICSQEVGVDLR